MALGKWALGCVRAGMHNIQPAGQMWPAEAFNLARETPNFVYFASFFGKNTLWMC